MNISVRQLSLSGICLLTAVAFSSCEDDPKVNVRPVVAGNELLTQVESYRAELTEHPKERTSLGRVFNLALNENAEFIESEALKSGHMPYEEDFLPTLSKSIDERCLHIKGLKSEDIAKILTVESYSSEDSDLPRLSILLRGTDPRRRLIVSRATVKRSTQAGLGSASLEIACLTEIIRVMTVFSILESPRMPFDIEFVVPLAATVDPNELAKTLPNGLTLLGIISLEEIVASKKKSCDFVVQFADDGRAALKDAAISIIRDLTGKSGFWSRATVDQSLPKISKETGKEIGQVRVPYVAFRAATSSKVRKVHSPKFVTFATPGFTEIETISSLVGSDHDRLSEIVSTDQEQAVVICRAIAATILRCGQALTKN